MRPLHALLIAAFAIASLGFVVVSLRQENADTLPTALSSAGHLPQPAMHHAPGISGHWGGAVVAAIHAPHDRSTLAGSITSWDAYLYGTARPRAARTQSTAAAPATAAARVSVRAAAVARQRSSAAASVPAPAPQRAHEVLEARAPPSCILRSSLLPAPSRICPRVFSPVCGCNGVVYSNKCESELAGVPHVGGAYCEMSFGQPLLLRGHVRPHAFGSSAHLPASAVAPPPRSRAVAPALPRHPLHSLSRKVAASTLSLLRRERNKLIQRERHDRRAISRLQTADQYNSHSKGLLGAGAAIRMLHAQDKAAQRAAADNTRVHALQLDEAANRRVARLLEQEEKSEEHHQ